MNERLSNVFEAARYEVRLGMRDVVLCVGERTPPVLREWLAVHAGSGPAWLITAHNPGARQLAPANNKARAWVLQQWVHAHADGWLDCVNRDPSGDWPDEDGLLMAGVEEGLARALALRFGQAALLAIDIESPVALLWVDPAPPGQASE